MFEKILQIILWWFFALDFSARGVTLEHFDFNHKGTLLPVSRRRFPCNWGGGSSIPEETFSHILQFVAQDRAGCKGLDPRVCTLPLMP